MKRKRRFFRRKICWFTCKQSKNKKYALAKRWNCSNKFLGKKVMKLYFDVKTSFFFKWKNTNVQLKLKMKRKFTGKFFNAFACRSLIWIFRVSSTKKQKKCEKETKDFTFNWFFGKKRKFFHWNSNLKEDFFVL